MNETSFLYILSSVVVPPTIEEHAVSRANLSVIAERPIVIDCPAVGTPTPLITWLKDEVEVDTVFDSGVRILSNGRRLEIPSSDISDAGSYRCVAKNPAGEIFRDFSLDVWGKSTFIVNTGLCKITLVTKTIDYCLALVVIVCVVTSVPALIEGSEIVSTPEVIKNRTIALICPAAGIPIPKVQQSFEIHTQNTCLIYSLTLTS